jgi:hypothetical protein
VEGGLLVVVQALEHVGFEGVGGLPPQKVRNTRSPQVTQWRHP